jgi:hypothetical protein
MTGPRAATLVTVGLRVLVPKSCGMRAVTLGGTSCCLLLSVTTTHCCLKSGTATAVKCQTLVVKARAINLQPECLAINLGF